MTIRFYHRANDGGIDEIVGRVRVEDTELQVAAEEGTAANSSLPVDDPEMDFEIRGHRKVYAVCTTIDAGSDDSAGVIGVWYTSSERTYQRKVFLTGAGRVVTLGLDDLNVVLSRRLITTNGKRPAETDLARIAWLLGLHVTDLIDDDSLVSTTGAVQMSEADYTKQSAFEVLSDCSQQSGKDFFVYNLKQTPDADGDPCLFSLFYDFTEAAVLESDLRISNDLTEYDGVDTFYANIEAQLTIDPAQVYSGVIVDYNGGWTYVQRPQTATDFALGGRDTTMSAPNTKTKSLARARGLRYLASLATEQHTIDVGTDLPGASLNRCLAGQRIQVQFTHLGLEGYADFIWMRILSRQWKQVSDDLYRVTLKLTRDISSPAFSSDSGGILDRGTVMDSSGQLFFDASGDAPEAGLPSDPTTGLIEMLSDPAEGGGVDRPFYGIKVNGTGTVDGDLFSTWAGVEFGIGTEYTITLALLVNGTIVDSEVSIVGIPADADGFLAFASGGVLLSFAGIAVVPDDVLTAVMTCSPPMPMFTVPSGAGQNNERFVITGGTLV